MAITKSAKKAIRQSLRKKKRNLVYKNKIKSLLKEASDFLSQKKTEESKKILPQIYKILDKAVKVGIIKENAADRKKSRITKTIFKSR